MPPKRKIKEEEEDEGSESKEENEAKEEATPAKAQDKKSKNTWTAAEDDALLKAVLEDQQDREAEGNGDDEEDWDEIAKAVPDKTPVQCLKRYMALNKNGTDPTESAQSETPDGKLTAKKARKDIDSSSRWTTEEVELLKKLVEQYKDSKCMWSQYNLSQSHIVCCLSNFRHA